MHDDGTAGEAVQDARPTMKTGRMWLVPLGRQHLPDLVRLDADPAVMRFLGDGRPRSAAEVASRMAGRTDPAAAARGLGYWSTFEARAFIGWGLLMPTEVAGEAELGYRLRPEFWGRGLATEIGAALIDHGFSTVGLRTILAQTMAVNSGSRAVMAKLGMRHIRTFTWEGPEQPIPGSEHGEVEYRLDRDAATGR
ncbi:GNAT family N-acetyltransferase [Naumannella halotolerans]|uniref:RimJ/RimL family protein N-acetyltransferase n=1 Tax=Naumannella halotolerans TaxID=993414 RepID=A0A4R7J9C5_9ACTN|nr:GNAT family N-acetyltransferase [Naumannella halotolerans]TDT34121.1 RimJ/RimL family protein N-acetyltransferase [Naumannella halotolerans]